jgi:AcrR family transcriptional regulator
MARTVDPERYAERRLAIVDAALTCFAAQGYDGATTAAICREAGIGSGTFFHYFPTKADVLVAILELGTQETAQWFAAQAGRTDAAGVLHDYVAHAATEAADPRVPGFVRAVGAVLGEPRIAAALAADEQTLREGLLPWVRSARSVGEVRADLTADRLADWLMLLLDGFLGRLAGGDGFTARRETATLHDAVRRLLAPA